MICYPETISIPYVALDWGGKNAAGLPADGEKLRDMHHEIPAIGPCSIAFFPYSPVKGTLRRLNTGPPA